MILQNKIVSFYATIDYLDKILNNNTRFIIRIYIKIRALAMSTDYIEVVIDNQEYPEFVNFIEKDKILDALLNIIPD